MTTARMPRPAAILLALLLAGGCTPDFDEEYLVKDLRILAIKADPPEVIQTDKSSLPPVTIEVLAVDPTAPGARVDWTMWACSAEEGRCLCPEEYADCDRPAVVKRIAGRSSRLDGIRVAYTLSEADYLAVRAADPLKGFGGVPLVVEVKIEGKARTVRGVKRIAYSDPNPVDRTPNRNPRVLGLAAYEPVPGDTADAPTPQTKPPIAATAEQELILVPQRNVLVVGDRGAVSRLRQITWERETTPTTERLNAAWVAESGRAWAVGDRGTILRFDPAQPSPAWTAVTSGTTERLNAIWGAADGTLFVVGDRGTILRFDGTSFTSMASGTTRDLNAVWGLNATTVVAVGDGGTALGTLGLGWAPLQTGTASDLHGVWGFGLTSTFAVGGGGTLLRFDGAKFTDASPTVDGQRLTTRTLRAVWGAVPGNLFAVGDGGTLLELRNERWSAATDVTSQDLLAVWGAGSNAVYAAGAGGTVLEYDSRSWTSWSPKNVGVGGVVRGVRGQDLRQSYVVPTFLGGTRRLEEWLTYSFYTTSGEISDPVTGGQPSAFVDLKKTTDLATGWTPAEKDSAARLWVVVRDDRGGVDWLQLSASIAPPE